MTRRVLLPVLALVVPAMLASDVRGTIQAGCAKIDITPPVGVWLSGYGARDKPSDDIQDDLYARALVVSDGNDAIALIAVDLLWVPLHMTCEIRDLVQTKTGIAAQNVMICASHTHFGPKIYGKTKLGPEVQDNSVDDAYVQTLRKKIADAVFLAHKDMQPARLGAKCTELAEVTFHRRPRSADESVTTTFSLPDEILATRQIVRDTDGTRRVTFRYPEDQPQLTFGPIDPQVWTIRVEDANGVLLGSMVNFACHAVSGSRYPEWFYSISGDYPGETARVVERVEGGVCLFTSGTAGDIVPLKRGKAPRYQIGRAVAGAAVRGLQFVSMADNATVAGKTMALEIPLREDLADNRIVDAETDQGPLRTEIQVLRLGDVYLLGLPGEILVELGLELKQKAPVERLVVASLANDVIGYVCHAAAYDEGGYESEQGTNLAKGAGELIVTRALELIEQMKHTPPAGS
ncbi:MAG: neutral/alkaline non-lysosomal ceramidase N-terminal domain-containing protein [Phycisphaerales bacterium]|nr:MAG: neutral/alkaline non-lysosomal ceramidase N-terminal domain-containing protein [Phycisphaerales bacterium]